MSDQSNILDLFVIDKIYSYLTRLNWKKINQEYHSLNYEISDASQLVYIEWDDILPPLRKRLVNNGFDTNIYHIISKMNPSTAKIAKLVEQEPSRELLDHFIVAKLPKRYKYSSGFNDTYGFNPSELDY